MSAQDTRDELRKSFTDNAKEFDSLMVTMLAENKKLLKELKASEKVADIVKTLNITAYDCINFPITVVISNEKELKEALKEYEDIKNG